jgi:predicted enzyme related to lactoylglutathione lyase
MKINEIAFTILPVSDLKKARSFYEEILGLKATSVFEKDGMGFIEYDIASGTLAIGSGSPLFKPSLEGGGIALEMEDFNEAIRHLREKNCSFLMEPYETPVCHMALIADPDLNRIMIHKRKKG